MLKEKSIYTIMNAGFLGGGRGYIGDGVGIDDAAWDEYMNALREALKAELNEVFLK